MNKLTNAEKKRITLWIILIIIGLVVYFGVYRSHAELPEAAMLRGGTATPVRTRVATVVGSSPTPMVNTPTRTATPTVIVVTATATLTPTVGATVTPTVPLPSPTPGSGNVTPYPAAPLCSDSLAPVHNNSLFHTLWDSDRGCHYDHEHGTDPFVPSVAQLFAPLGDLKAFIGGVEVGHSNPSSPIENTDKHQGMKWDVTLAHAQGCGGIEGADIGVNAFASQYHAFGDYSIEMEARVHSALAFMRQCVVGGGNDFGYVGVIQHVDYGQRVRPYQGPVLPYPDSPNPSYDQAREPYFSVDCFGGPANGKCARNPSREFILNNNQDANSTWTSENVNLVGAGSDLFFILFRIRDLFQVSDASDNSYATTPGDPGGAFSFRWLCSNDGGLTHAAKVGCRYNNSTTRIHAIGGFIPFAWDNLGGLDSDPRVGRITGTFFVSATGDLMPEGECFQMGLAECFPMKLVAAYPGRFASSVTLFPSSGPGKVPVFFAGNLPERDVYFCGNVVCDEFDSGAKSSGWIGKNN